MSASLAWYFEESPSRLADVILRALDARGITFEDVRTTSPGGAGDGFRIESADRRTVLDIRDGDGYWVYSWRESAMYHQGGDYYEDDPAGFNVHSGRLDWYESPDDVAECFERALDWADDHPRRK